MNGFFAIIRRFKVATTLNLLGLVAALTTCYVLWTQVEFAEEFNHNIEDHENVYRMELNGAAGMDVHVALTCRPLAERIALLPQVEGMMLWDDSPKPMYIRKDGEFLQERAGGLLAGGLKMLKLKMLCGTDSLASETDILLPASLAEKYFGERMVAGRSIETTRGERRVAGVFEDFPENCMFPNVVYCNMGDECKDSFTNWNFYAFLRIVDGTDIEGLRREAMRIAIELQVADNGEPLDREAIEKSMETDGIGIELRRIGETYFSGIDVHDRGSRSMMLVLKLACLLLLVVAAINFANFTLAETPMRIKGINTRKVLGMSNRELRLGMIGETLLTSMTAFLLSLAAVHLLSLSPEMHNLVVGTLALDHHPLLILYIGMAAAVIGLTVGIYPAFYATSFPPALVLKGSFGLSPRGRWLRKVLVGIQLFVVFVMTIYIGVLALQSSFIFNSDYGYDKDAIVCSDEVILFEQMERHRLAMENIPGVEAVDYAQSLPGTSDMQQMWGRGVGERNVKFACMPVSWKFLRVMGIDIVEGHDFTEHDGDSYIINEAFHSRYEWAKAGQAMEGEDDSPIVGMCKNFRVFTTRRDNATEPAAFLCVGERYNWGNAFRIVARISKNSDKRQTISRLNDYINKMLPEGTQTDGFRFMDDQLQQAYEEELRFISQVEAFSLISLIITLIGVFCLTMFETEYRRKEIGIRKILGSTSRDIILMFCRRYTLLIAIAFVLAAPLAYIMAEQWLQNFAERTDIPWWLFPTSLLLGSAVVLLTVAAQTWRTAIEPPVKAIKSE